MMMSRIVTFLAMFALLGLSTDRALATDLGGSTNMSAIQGAVTGDGIINFNVNGTLTMDANGTGVTTISVAAGKAAVIQFNATANTIQFIAGAGAITIGGGGSLTIAGTNTSAGIDFATNNTNATLTVNGSIAGAVNANVLTVGNNTLTVSAAATFAGTVSMGGANATLDNNAATTVTTLTMTGALNITPANNKVLTLTNAVSVGANTLTITGSGGGTSEAVNGTITLNNASSQLTTAGADKDDILGNVAIVVSADGATLDVNFNTSPPSVTQNAGVGNLTLQVAAGKVLTTTVDVNDNTLTLPETGTVSTIQLDTASGIVDLDASATATTLSVSAAATVDLDTDLVNFTVTNPFNIGANKLSLVGSGGGGQETFSATVQLNGGTGSELEVTGADVDDITGFTVSVTADGGTLDTNINTAPTAVNMSTAAGDLTLEVATGKTLTTTVDVNDNSLTLSETGTVSTIQLDTASGIIDLDASATATTLSVSAAATVDLDTDLVNFTVTNPFNIGANKLFLVGSGGGGQETFSATVQLNGGTGSELEVTGADVDDITGFTVRVTADGGTLDTNINTAPTAVNMSAAAGDLTLEVATGKTLTTTVDVNDNTLTLSTGTATISRVDATTGTITDNAGVTISDLRAQPGVGNTFTFGGTGSATATTLADALTDANNKLNKVGTGTLTITNGLTNAFDNAAGVLIDIDAGILVVGSAGSNEDITFDDDADEITVASGATLTTFGSFTVDTAAANVNVDAVAGSTVNLSATSAKAFTGVADDDFTLLGTVNINGSGSYTIADGFNYKFGSVIISDGCSLVNNQPNGEIKFVPSSTVTLNGSGGLTINGQAAGTPIILDTTTGAGSFTLNRTASPNLSLQFVNLSRCTYTSSTEKQIASCDGVALTGTTLLSGTQNWEGVCGGGGGGSLDQQNDNSTTVEVVIDVDGGATLMTTTDSGATAEVTVSDAAEGQTISVTLEDSNTLGTFAGMAGGDNGLGNGVPRTLTIETGLAKGTFKAVVQLCVSDADLSANNLTRERVGLFVFNESTGEWEVKGTNNRGDAQPTSNVGDHGIFQDGFESGSTCAWAVVDDFATFIVGEMTTFTLNASASSADSGSVAIDPVQTVYSEGMQVNLAATPTSGFEFTDWLINDQELATDNPLQITMDQDTVLVGQFDLVDMPEFVLSLTQNDADGGTITASPQASTYLSGTEVTLTATPAEGFVFAGWTGDAAGNDNPLQVTIASNLSIGAAFEAVLLDGDNQAFGACGAGAECGALGILSMTLMLLGLAGMRRSSRHR